jgi:uncharacterized protein (TIGR03083 family)
MRPDIGDPRLASGCPSTIRHDERMTDPGGEAQRQRWIEAVVEEGERVGVLGQELSAGLTAAPGGLNTTVPWVPAWTARELIGHLGTVHRWATDILRAGNTDPPSYEVREEPPADGLLDWYAAGLTTLVSTLRSVPPRTPAWHMSPAAEKVAASWARRQAHELVVHRMDLEAAAGMPPAPVDPALAEDGVDELLATVLARWAHTEPLNTAQAACAVTATDTGRAWSVRVDSGVVTVEPGRFGTEDAELHAPANQLLLRLWGRPADVAVSGDPAAEALLRGR